MAKDEYKIFDTVLDKYVFVVPLKIYEPLVEDKSIPYDSLVYLYHKGIRIMWSNKVKKAILITKDEYNKTYNPCSFVSLI